MKRHPLSTSFLTLVVLVVANVGAGAHATDDVAADWIEFSPDPANSCWREGRHRGWSNVGDARLDAASERRLAGDDGAGVLLSRGDSDLYTKQEFQDCEVKLEFMVPRGSNSGVKLNGQYEIQIRDTFGKPADQLTGDDCGGVYPRGENRPRYHQIDKGVAPKVNAAKPAGEWQTLEITFRAARFDSAGKKTENARFVRVVHNGQVIHEDVELKHPTGAAWDEQTEIPRGPFQLQGNHGPVAFRKIAIRPLGPN
jgi:hypothetical protein